MCYFDKHPEIENPIYFLLVIWVPVSLHVNSTFITLILKICFHLGVEITLSYHVSSQFMGLSPKYAFLWCQLEICELTWRNNTFPSFVKSGSESKIFEMSYLTLNVILDPPMRGSTVPHVRTALEPHFPLASCAFEPWLGGVLTTLITMQTMVSHISPYLFRAFSCVW